MSENKYKKPAVVLTRYNPYLVVGIEEIESSDGDKFKMENVTALCRCGGSSHKPYCDGTHSKIEFDGSRDEGLKPGKTRSYEGKDITINDNRRVCAHDGNCTRSLPSVFKSDELPWIDPNGASVKEIIETIEGCPSGALSYTIGSRRYQNLERPPKIIVQKNGPYKIQGGIELTDDAGSVPEASEHYTLCRCGKARNKPFCDGTHIDIDFKG